MDGLLQDHGVLGRVLSRKVNMFCPAAEGRPRTQASLGVKFEGVCPKTQKNKEQMNNSEKNGPMPGMPGSHPNWFLQLSIDFQV